MHMFDLQKIILIFNFAVFFVCDTLKVECYLTENIFHLYLLFE